MTPVRCLDTLPSLLGVAARLAVFSLILAASCMAQDRGAPQAFHSESAHHNPPDLSVVSNAQWQAIERSVARGLAYVASQQQSDGSIPTIDEAKPAVTALYAMALISAGHQPGEGKYGESLNRAIDFILSCQLENGLFSRKHVTLATNSGSRAGQLAMYNQGICGTLLGEIYGMVDLARASKVKTAIAQALQFVHEHHRRPLANPLDRGGFRYVKRISPGDLYSDLSVTSWQIMFMRSAHNAGFEVPKVSIDDSIAFVRRCYVPRTGDFRYAAYGEPRTTRGLTGAGVLCLFLTGHYDDKIERTSGNRLLEQPFTQFNTAKLGDRYFYAAYYCSQAAYQLGGDYWEKIYVPLAATLIENQQADGSWAPDHRNGSYRQTYSTAMGVLALTPPYQLLPIYQR